jgi:putative thioredoxin
MTSLPGGPTGGFDARGAVDLGALAAAREAQARAEAQAQSAREEAARRAESVGADADAPAGATPAAPAEGVYPGAFVTAVAETEFQAEVMDRSHLVPIVLDFWAEWCEPCKQLSPMLERLAEEYAGQWVLATIDVDANQRLGQAFQIQSIPTLYAVIQGQPVPLFQGVQPEAQVRQVLDQLLQVAAQAGVSGRVDGIATTGTSVAANAGTPARDAEQDGPPELDEAADAVERGDLAAAADAYRRLLAREPANADATAGLGLIGLLERTAGVDAQAAVDAATADPSDVETATRAADVLVLSRQPEAALALLVESVRRTTGEDRDRARTHLLTLIDVLGEQDPAVAPARRALAAALF